VEELKIAVSRADEAGNPKKGGEGFSILAMIWRLDFELRIGNEGLSWEVIQRNSDTWE
jgi:hypothetical protein